MRYEMRDEHYEDRNGQEFAVAIYRQDESKPCFRAPTVEFGLQLLRNLNDTAKEPRA